MTSSSRTHRWVPAVAIVGLVALLASCSSSQKEVTAPTGTVGQMKKVQEEVGPPQSGGSLAYCNGGEVEGYNPTQGRWTTPAYTVANAIYDPLFAYDEESKPQPYLAESAEHNENFTEWKIKIRQGVTFHNGTPLNAEAVAVNLNAGKNSGLTAAAFEPVTSITATGPFEVTVKMKSPWSTFLHLLTAQPGYMEEPSLVGDPSRAEESNRRPIGTGPFQLIDWVPNNFLKVRKYDNYWRKDRPYLDEITFKVIVDFQGRAQSLESGQCDAMEMGDAAQIKKFQAEAEAGKVQMYTDAGVEVQEIFITLNLDREPFNDPLARQILAYGIDTERVCGEGFLGVFPPARGPFDKSSPYFTDTGYPTYDPAKAAELHEQYKAKYGKPLEFESIIPPVNEYQQVAQLVAQMGDEIGVKSNIKTVELTALTAQLVGGQYQASGTILFGSPSLDREYVFIASEPKPSGQLSLNFARNPNWSKVKEWMDKARATDDEQQQIEAYKKVQEQLNEDLPYIWLCHSRSSIVFRNNVHGFDAATIPGTDQLVQQSITPFFYQVWVKR